MVPLRPTFAAFDPGRAAPDGAVCPGARPDLVPYRAGVRHEDAALLGAGRSGRRRGRDHFGARHQRRTSGLPPYAAAAGETPIKLTLVRQGRFVVCIVSDPSDQAPRCAPADDVCENGRGLHVIEALSRAWGWTPLPGAGKAVWAALTAAEERGAGFSQSSIAIVRYHVTVMNSNRVTDT